jgi:D-amino-acid oxidase
MHEFVVNYRAYEAGELPFNSAHATSFDTMMVDTPHYLRMLERDIRLRGGKIVVQAFDDVAQVAALPETVVFNCTGLGAGVLFGDTEIEPARGQLVILEPQPEIDYNIITDGNAYMFGRRDGVVLGGTFQHGNWSLEPSAEDTARILAANARLFTKVAAA